MSDHYDRYNGMKNLLGTNLASLGTDCISRQSAIDALRGYLVGKRCPDDGTLTCRLIENEVIKQLQPIQPADNLQKLADEIALFKRCFKSENSDYLTGYLSALSVVEGMIADMREVTT